MSGIHAELGNASHDEELRDFVCCLPHPRYGGRPRCPEEWSHKVQKHIQNSAIARSRVAGGEPLDNRLLLLWDGGQLVGVAAHERVESQALPRRSIEFLAVRTQMRKTLLSDGRRCSDALLDLVIEDAKERDTLLTELVAVVDHRNRRSLQFMQRRDAQVGSAVIEGCRPVLLTV